MDFETVFYLFIAFSLFFTIVFSFIEWFSFFDLKDENARLTDEVSRLKDELRSSKQCKCNKHKSIRIGSTTIIFK